MNNKKLHWYNLSYKTPYGFANHYVGNEVRRVTKPQIEDAKNAIQIATSSVLISASYLGFMTSAEFKGE